jgi:hypothetical protein
VKLEIAIETSDKPYNLKMVLIGMILFVFRLLAIQPYYEIDGRVNPDMLHTSKLISILTFISLICCFRYKILNSIPVVGFPMTIVAFIADDFNNLIHPITSGFFLWLDALMNHLLVIFIGAYILIIIKNSISIQSLFIAMGIVIAWFICVDDHINGHLNGLPYILICLSVFIAWDSLILSILSKYKAEMKNQDVFIALLVRKIIIRRIR